MAKMRLVGAGNPNPVLYLTMSGTMSNAPNIGEDVDLTGLTFTAHYYNGATENVTNKVLLSRKKWGETVGTQKLEVGYDNKKVVITVSVVGYLDSIEVKTPPTKTAYRVGETIDTTGMVITEKFEDESEVDITQGFVISPTVMASDTTEITISVTVGDITKTTTQELTLVSLDSISVDTPPTKTAYKVGETISASGLVLTATYTDESEDEVTEGYTFTPDTMASDTTAMTISFTSAGVTKTTTQALTLVSLDSISVKTPPTVTSFAQGADIDLTGLVLEATYTDDSTDEVTEGYTFLPTVMAEDTTEVTISYTENGITKTTTQAVTLAE